MTLRLSTGFVNEAQATGSVKATMEGATGFLIDIYTGNRPASPDMPATGSKLVTVSVDDAGTGMHFEGDPPASGVMVKESSENWSGTIDLSGTAGYFRMRRIADTGLAQSATDARIDGTIASSGADFNLSSLSLIANAPFIISAASFTFPQGL